MIIFNEDISHYYTVSYFIDVIMKKSIVLSGSLSDENLHMPVWYKALFFMVLLFIVFIPATFNQDINAAALYIIIPFLFIYSLYKSLFLFRKFRFFRLF